MKIKVKRSQLLDFSKIFEDLSRIRDTKFAYFIAKNKHLIKGELEAINAARQPPKGFDSYEQERIRLIGEYAQKDERGDPVVIEKGMFKLQNINKFNESLKDLQCKYAEVLNEIDKKEKELKVFIEEEIEMELLAIKVKSLPKDLASNEMDILMPLLDGTISDFDTIK
jgi:hypothetical protein